MSIQYVKDKLLVGTMYAPFCRTKYVDTSEWEQDIRRMAEMGYTCLHGFSEWWRVEKQKGVFDFSEQDYLIELCVKYGIVPIVNVATQNGVGYYMPRWMQNEYKGRGVIAGDGQANDVDCEYVLPCMDDPWSPSGMTSSYTRAPVPGTNSSRARRTSSAAVARPSASVKRKMRMTDGSDSSPDIVPADAYSVVMGNHLTDGPRPRKR